MGQCEESGACSAQKSGMCFKRRVIWFYVPLCIFTIILDQVTKHYISSTMPLHDQKEIIQDIFYIVHVVNYGAAWGILSGKLNFLALVSITFFIFGIVKFKYLTEGVREREWAFALLLGGVFGNFIDRVNLIPRPSGVVGVVDFISFQYRPKGWQYPAFNVADMAICIGVGIYLLSSFCRKPVSPQEDELKKAE